MGHTSDSPERAPAQLGAAHVSGNSGKLPVNYSVHLSVDLNKDRKPVRAVRCIIVLIGLVAVGVAVLLPLPLETSWGPLLASSVTLGTGLMYMAAHEATHGAALRILTKARPKYRLRFPFLTTGTDAYLTRRDTVIVALAPAAVWGILLLATILTVPGDYRLTAYIVLALNFAGSAGDIVEAYLASRQRPEALIQDDGGTIRVLLPRE